MVRTICLAVLIFLGLPGFAHASDESWEDWAAFDGLPPDFQPIEGYDFVDVGLVRDAVSQSPVKLLVKIRPGLRSPLLKYSLLYATVYSSEYGPVRRERFEYNPKSGQVASESKGADIMNIYKDGGDLYISIDLHNLVVGSGQVATGMRDFGPKHRICFAYQSSKEADIGGYLDIIVSDDGIGVSLNNEEMQVR